MLCNFDEIAQKNAISTFCDTGYECNFHGITISTFSKPIFEYNFDEFTISTISLCLFAYNFNEVEFQRAREARQRKNNLQFQRPDNFYFLRDNISLQFLHVRNLYV